MNGATKRDHGFELGLGRGLEVGVDEGHGGGMRRFEAGGKMATACLSLAAC
jgi:hypothetical protein